MSQSPMVTNGTVGMSPQHNHEMNNDAKKAKLDQNQVSPPSKVVHIRSLPSDVTESEVVQLGLPFGRLTNMLLLKQKNQAFLEFGDEQAASTMISYYQSTPAQIRSKSIFVQYSNHKELKTDASHSFQNATAQAALQAAQAVMLGSSPDDQKTILHVIVEQVLFPVSIDTLHQIFCKFGKILKAIIFTKNGTFQALIQFGDAVAARTAKLSLDGQNIYNGCCTLRIDYSKLNNLNVKYNNDKSRDFTNPNLPVGDPSIDGQMHMGAMSSMGGIPGAIPSPFPMPGLGAQPLTTYSAAGAPGFGGLAAMPVPGFGLPAASPMANSRMGAGMGMTMGMGMGMGMPMTAPIGSSVILVSNLDEQKVTPDALFTLFGVYGDVHRVKILYQKKDNALIQMAEPHQAQLALAHLDKVKVWGKPIRVAQSKHSLVQMPKEGQPDAGLTKDFTNSPLHRFKRPGSKNCQNIFPPSAVLHLSNIPPSVSEDVITDLFSDYGNVTGFKFFQKDRKMALIQMETDEEAIHALIGLHNYQLSDSQHLRVSFSKSTLQ